MAREQEKRHSEPINIRLGQALAQALADSGKSKAQSARDMNTSTEVIDRYITGERKVTVEWVERFANVTGTTAGTIFTAAGVIPSGTLEADIDNDVELSPEQKNLLKVVIKAAREASGPDDGIGRSLKK